jgi:hypothetical protein
MRHKNKPSHSRHEVWNQARYKPSHSRHVAKRPLALRFSHTSFIQADISHVPVTCVDKQVCVKTVIVCDKMVYFILCKAIAHLLQIVSKYLPPCECLGCHHQTRSIFLKAKTKIQQT